MMKKPTLKALEYIGLRYLLFKKFAIAQADDRYFHSRFKFRVEDIIGRTIYKYGGFDDAHSDFLIKYFDFSQPRTLFDLGANIGWFSVLFSKMGQDASHVFSFEPDELNFQLLSENLELNQCQNVTAIKKAVSEEAKEQKFYIYPHKNTGRHSLVPNEEQESVIVQTVTLDEFCQEQSIKKIDFIKIDIEGYEYFALKGGEGLLDQTGVILLEYSPQFYQPGFEKEKLVELLDSHQFVAHVLENGKLKPISNKDILARSVQVNLIWINTAHQDHILKKEAVA